MRFEEIASAIREYHPDPDLELVQKAYAYAEIQHHGHMRASGEPYINHLVETALLVCRLKLDMPSVAAALLHDVIEDCDITAEDLKKEFSSEVVEMVEGVTKLTRLGFQSREQKQAESFRKMLIAMSKDIRVILLKLCDRLHNMRTMEYLNDEKRREKATETKEIYAPLAYRLGLFWLKSELEDCCFQFLRPALYNRIKKSFEAVAEEQEAYIKKTTAELIKLLEDAGLSAYVKGRAKHLYSIWQKMERQNLTFEEIYDLIGFRIIVPTFRACYETLGIVHGQWRPVPGRFKDYIAMPKPNLYQSLHTTVIGPSGQRVEIQIRTVEMDNIAEEGIAAHWRYKEGGQAKVFDLQWVRELAETQQYLRDPDEFIQSVKGELFPKEIFVFTPKGDLIRLPYRSTPVDFAYAIHSDIGRTASRAKVNGSVVPLSSHLENGDTVQIMTSPIEFPKKEWLQFARSSKAKQKIRSFLKTEAQAKSKTKGVEILTSDLDQIKFARETFEQNGQLLKVAQDLGLKDEGELYAEIGYGKLKSETVISMLFPEDQELAEKLGREVTPLRRIFQQAARVSREKVGIAVKGMDNPLVRFGKCCEPLPGERIVGFVSRGRGVTVHCSGCPQALGADPRCQVEVAWDDQIKIARKVKLKVYSQNKRDLLANVSTLITDKGVDIKSAQIKTTDFGKALISLELSLEDSGQLRQITHSVEMLPGVIKVERAGGPASVTMPH